MDIDDDDDKTPSKEDIENDKKLSAAQKKRSDEVDKAIGEKNWGAALKASLSDPPYDAADIAIKDEATKTVVKVLSAIKDEEVDGACADLKKKEFDILMKYLYRGLALAQNSGQLLKWHAYVVEKSGIASIVRAITEKKTVLR